MRKLFYISLLIAVAGCSSPLIPQPPPPPPNTDLSAYFWADSNATYVYNAGNGDVHTITVNVNGTIVDNDAPSGSNTTLSVTRSNNAISLTGFSTNDFLGLDPDLQVVQDTTVPTQRMETIRSIAAVNIGFNTGKLYAISDSVLYQVDLHSDTLVRVGGAPAAGLTLAEDVGGSGLLFAYQKGGSQIFTSPDGVHWATYTLSNGSGITAFAVTDIGQERDDEFWVALGSQLWWFSRDLEVHGPIPSPAGAVTAMEASLDGVVVSGSNGQVYDIPREGSDSLLTTLSSPVFAFASNYASTASGIYYINPQGGTKLITNDNDSALYSTGYSIFGGRLDGSVGSVRACPRAPHWRGSQLPRSYSCCGLFRRRPGSDPR